MQPWAGAGGEKNIKYWKKWHRQMKEMSGDFFGPAGKKNPWGKKVLGKMIYINDIEKGGAGRRGKKEKILKTNGTDK